MMAMTAPFRDMYHQGNDKTKEALVQMLQFHIKQYKEAKTKNDTISVVHNFLRHLDLQMQQALKTDHDVAQRVACGKGCSACCKMNVDITLDEAEYLLAFAKEKHISIDWDKADRQHQITEWKLLSEADRECLFLDSDGECKIYENRPMVCRKLMVIDTAEFCDIHKYPGHELGRINSIEAEAMVSAIWNEGETASLPTLLRKVKAKTQ